MGQDFTHVRAYITDDSINLTNIQTLITILETAFGDQDHVTIVKRKLEELKQTNPNFSTDYVVY
jgi:hypothetical protein